MLLHYLLLTHVSYIRKHVDIASLLTNKKKFYTIYLISPFLWGFPGGSVGKESTCNTGDVGSIPGSGRSPGVGNGSPFQYSCLENFKGRGVWLATDHVVTKSQTQLSD